MSRSPWPFKTTSPSILSGDRKFMVCSNGKTPSQIASETVDRQTRLHGTNPSKIVGISRRERLATPRNPHDRANGVR